MNNININLPNYIQIIENIHKELMVSELSDNIGLHAGTSGIALFLSYYDRIIFGKNEISSKIMEILEHNIECINSGKRLHTICSGISGFGWLCEHLRKLEMLILLLCCNPNFWSIIFLFFLLLFHKQLIHNILLLSLVKRKMTQALLGSNLRAILFTDTLYREGFGPSFNKLIQESLKWLSKTRFRLSLSYKIPNM